MPKYNINLSGTRSLVIETDGAGDGSMTAIGLREACPDCGEVDCERTCPKQASWDDAQEQEARLLFNASVHGVESLLLALACLGVKVDSPKFTKALETTLDQIANHYD
jgi:hypothetical protein